MASERVEAGRAGDAWGGGDAVWGDGVAEGAGAGPAAVPPRCDAHAAANTAPISNSRTMLLSLYPSRPLGRMGALCLGAAEDRDHLGPLARDAEQLPAALAHVGAPADQLLPLLRGGAKHTQIRHLLPVGGIRLGRRGHEEVGGRAISRVL